MKIRNGFVSNSSSSSFICQICNHTEVGMDLGLEEAGFVECVNGHTFCESHILGKVEDENYEHYELPEVNCPICNYEEISYSDIRRYFVNTSSITTDEVFAEVKKVNKRRKKLYDTEYVEYVLKSKGMTADDLLLALKTQYPKYTDFMASMRR